MCAPEQDDFTNAALVFEFLIYAENNAARTEERKKDKGNQVTVGWASVPLQTLAN